MRFLKIFSILIVVTVFLYIGLTAADGSVYEDVIRLHVIANSDSEPDQSLKLEVRDYVLQNYSELLSGYSDKDKALAAAEELLGEMEQSVDAFLADKSDYTCEITLKEEYFPTRTYGQYSLPRGNYTALCIRLGKAEGKNFWCVLYPPLCLGVCAETDESLFLSCGLTESEYQLMKGEKTVYKVKFRLLELLSGKEKAES